MVGAVGGIGGGEKYCRIYYLKSTVEILYSGYLICLMCPASTQKKERRKRGKKEQMDEHEHTENQNENEKRGRSFCTAVETWGKHKAKTCRRSELVVGVTCL